METEDAKGRGDGALCRRKNGADEQGLGMVPGPLAEIRAE